ncbi:MAG: hypothetical protein KF841_03290 [Phycisphaerae bacterium]|nr:hypothetical protein [Phycisphaerae bacterium]
MEQPQEESTAGRISVLFGSVIEHLIGLARTDSRLAELLDELGRGLIHVAAAARSATSQVESEGRSGADDNRTAVRAEAPAWDIGDESDDWSSRAERNSALAELPPITFGSATNLAAATPRQDTRSPGAGEVLPDLNLIEKRCRIKAQGCRWQVKRTRLLGQGANFQTEILPLDDEIIQRAREVPDCYLWMCNPNAAMPEDPAHYDDLADCFDLVGDAAALLRMVENGSDESEGDLEKAMDLAAEAQSMLRGMLQESIFQRDSDQLKMFNWLRLKAWKARILINRYMRLDDTADPTSLNDLRERLRTADEELTRRRERQKSRREDFNKIRYHLKQVEQRSDQDHDNDWKTISETVDRMVNDGLAASSVELRDLLLPFVDTMPDAVAEHPAMQRVLTEIDRYIASRRPSGEVVQREPPTEAIMRVASLLSGKSILLIGGEMRPHSKQAIETAFGLRELIWMKTREHNTRVDFDPDVSRPDVAVVILAIRWSRHSYADVEISCKKYEKPLVRLPAGYNPRQVAESILEQCSNRLESD